MPGTTSEIQDRRIAYIAQRGEHRPFLDVDPIGHRREADTVGTGNGVVFGGHGGTPL